MQKYSIKRTKALLALCLVAFVAVIVFVPQTASADMGPKPSIRITFTNMPDEVCYVTILSQNKSTGPYCVYDPDGDYKAYETMDPNYYNNPDYHNEELESIWQIFVDYEDVDGYYFLQLWGKCDSNPESHGFNWTYYPPYSFKLLLYYPERDIFVTSAIYERYAFDSYYTVDMKDVDLSAIEQNPQLQLTETLPLVLTKSYDYTWEIVSLIFRIVLTIAIEMAIALLFRIKGRKPLLTILVTNIVTQIALNVALNLLCYFDGFLMLIFLYLPLELGVIFVEALAYGIILHKQGVPIWKALLYALVANVVSGALGFAMAWFIPGLF